MRMEKRLKYDGFNSLISLLVKMKKLLLSLTVVMCGCTLTNPFDRKPIRLDSPYHKYYVIDANSDIPDAYFETFDDAAVYQKDFAENHEYVIVKIDKRYNVYNVEPVKK
jgi:hypothetical protein